MSNTPEQKIEAAVIQLSKALKDSDADHTTVEQVLSRVRKLAYRPLSEEEGRAQALVTEALAAQRAVALFRTETRLYREQANRSARLVPKLERAAAILQREYDILDSDISAGIRKEEAQQRQLAETAEQMEELKIEEFVVLRRQAHMRVANLMLREEKQYRHEFQKALKTQGGLQAAEQVYRVVRPWEKRGTKKQFVPTIYDSTTPDYLEWLSQQSQASLISTSSKGFTQLVQTLARDCRGQAIIAPLKGHARIIQKAQDKYQGDFSKVLDMVRGMVVFEQIADLAQALQLLDQYDRQGTITLVRGKDRLSNHYDACQMAGGYRDVLLNIQLPIANDAYLITELQLHLKSFLKIKNDRGHVNYESARTIHMFNSAFTTRSFLWEKDTPEAEISALLTDIRLGVITRLNLDHSNGLWTDAAKERLRDAFQDSRCAVREISMRSCRCGDDFILLVLNDDYMSTIPPVDDLPPVVSTLRLGSQIHQGTAGRITKKGITALLRYLNPSLRVLDLEGCLDLDWCENCGDDVATAVVEHVEATLEANETTPLPQFQELNLQSTGLTEAGLQKLLDLRKSRKLPQLKVLHDEDLSRPPRRIDSHRRASVLNASTNN